MVMSGPPIQAWTGPVSVSPNDAHFIALDLPQYAGRRAPGRSSERPERDPEGLLS